MWRQYWRTTGIAGLILSACLPSQALSQTTTAALEHCITVASVLPLLGTADDTPLVRVTIDGQAAAIFVTPEIAHLLVRDVSDQLWFPNQGSTLLMAQDHQLVTSEQTTVDDMTIGAFRFEQFPAYMIHPTFTKTIGTLPIVGVLGRNALIKGLILMIDIPHHSIALLKWDHDHCGPASTLLGPDAQTAGLSDNNASEGTIAGKRFDIHFDPDLAYNILPQSETETIALTDEQLQALPSLNVKFAEINVGHLSTPYVTTIHGNGLGAQQFVIEPHVSDVTLGNPFFRTRTVLFDFGQHQISYIDVPDPAPDPVPPTSHAIRHHFDMTYVPLTSVEDSFAHPDAHPTTLTPTSPASAAP